MINYTNNVRVTFDINKDINDKLSVLIPWGSKRVMIESSLKLLVQFIEEQGLGHALDSLISGNVEISKVDK